MSKSVSIIIGKNGHIYLPKPSRRFSNSVAIKNNPFCKKNVRRKKK